MPLTPEDAGLIVFWLVAAARILLPLAIPRYPLPGILASLLLDGVDQTIFQGFPAIDLSRYQNYDKSLDIYYLTIAYISTLRNWKNHFAFQVGRFLFYWRLFGVVLFEITQLRALLLFFPNTFEYFFIFYEAYRLRWDPIRMTRGFLVGTAAAILIIIKLPQEYWIHIAQIDTTDWIKTGLFSLTADTSWSLILRTWSWGFLVAAVIAVLVVFAAWWILRLRLPPADRTLAFSADAHQPAFTTRQVRKAVTSEARQIMDAALLEKVILITLVSISFAHILPRILSTDLQLALGVVLIVVLNTILSHWLARRGFGKAFTLSQFFVLLGVNLLMMFAVTALRLLLGEPVGTASALFFAFLLSLLITLFDRYRQVYIMRFDLP